MSYRQRAVRDRWFVTSFTNIPLSAVRTNPRSSLGFKWCDIYVALIKLFLRVRYC